MPEADDKIVDRIRQKFEIYSTEWQPIRAEADEDMRYVAGDPWTSQDRRLREEAMRPVQVTDVLHQYFNQVINDVRLNPRAVKFSPTGLGTNDARAKFYNDKWREIEYRSNAARHYITALENCIYRGFGWVRVTSKYASQRGRTHELLVEGVPNPNMILPDPEALQPDSSDMMGLIAYQTIDVEAFKKKYSKAKVTSFDADMQRTYPAWIKDARRLQLAEYWEVSTLAKELLVLSRELAVKYLQPKIMTDMTHDVHHQLRAGTPVGVFADELATVPGDHEISERVPVEDRKVTQYITNGVELLEPPNVWPGKYIPFASCFGKVLYLDHGGTVTRQILSMTRLARNPYMALCYLATVKLELIGMIPKFPYFFYEGQLSPKSLSDLQKSLHEPVAGIEVKPFIEGAPGQLLPPPSRQPYSPELQQIEAAYESTIRSVASAMGISPLPTPAQRNNEKTGAALERIESSGQKGSFHYVDNYDAMIRQVGVIGEDLMTPIYDTLRTTGVRDALGNASQIVINNPENPDSSTKGSYLVTVSSGPSFESAREASKDFIGSLMESPILLQAAGPQIAAKVLAMGIRLQNIGEIGSAVADLLDPPPNQQQTPQVLQAQLQKATQQLQQMQQALQKLTLEQQADAVKVKGNVLMKQIDVQNALTIKKMDDATKITVAMIGAKTKTDISQNEARDEAIALDVQVAHEERMAAHEHVAEATAHGLDHAHDVRQALVDHASKIQQATQEHHHAIAQLIAGAALAPEPAAQEPPAS